MSISVAVAGASGYAGGELVRLLAGHTEFDVRTVTAFRSAGRSLGTVHRHLRARAELTLVDTTREALSGHDVVFLTLPHGSSGEIAAALDTDTLVIDCGADHRLQDEREWNKFYGGQFFGTWTYGLPELVDGASRDGRAQRDALRGVSRIAVPGCNATAVTLGIAPGLRAGVVRSDDLVAVLTVGTSGAGKSPSSELIASEVIGSASAYAVGGVHRHVPEIIQNLAHAGRGQRPTISFTPVIVPMSRGILATTTASLERGASLARVRSAWEDAYEREPFVHVLPAGQFPRTSDVVGSNVALIGLALDEAAQRVVTVTALDNLVKGTAGAAIQSANIALGITETTGLIVDGMAP